MRSVLGHNTLLYTTPQQCGNISYCEVWLFFVTLTGTQSWQLNR